MDEIPVFAKAGAIVPLGPRVGWGGVDNPEAAHIYVFPGADNRFELYEDDGETRAYRQGNYALTPLVQEWQAGRLTFSIEPAIGDRTVVPPERAYTLFFRGIAHPEKVTVLINGYEETVTTAYDEETQTLRLAPLSLKPGETLTVTLTGTTLMPQTDFRPETLRRMVRAFRLQTAAKAAIADRVEEIANRPSLLSRYAMELKKTQMQALLEVSTEAGVHYVDHAGDKGHLILWNNQQKEPITYHLARTHHRKWDEDVKFRGEQGTVPQFWATVPAEAWPAATWRLSLSYAGLVEVVATNGVADGSRRQFR
jgi:hypothetical protein